MVYIRPQQELCKNWKNWYSGIKKNELLRGVDLKEVHQVLDKLIA